MSKVQHTNADYFIDQTTLTDAEMQKGLLDGSLVMLNSGDVLRRADYIPPKKTPLHDAAKKGNVTEFVNILHEDDDVDLLELNSIGDNLLHCAASGENNWIVHIVLTRCTKEEISTLINQRGDAGSTPLQWAVLSNNQDMVNSFLYYGAKIDPADAEGYTAMHFAVSDDCSVSILKLLVEHTEEQDLKSLLMKTTECGCETVFDTAMAEEHKEACAFLQPYAEMMGVEGFTVPTEGM